MTQWIKSCDKVSQSLSHCPFSCCSVNYKKCFYEAENGGRHAEGLRQIEEGRGRMKRQISLSKIDKRDISVTPG